MVKNTTETYFYDKNIMAVKVYCSWLEVAYQTNILSKYFKNNSLLTNYRNVISLGK